MCYHYTTGQIKNSSLPFQFKLFVKLTPFDERRTPLETGGINESDLNAGGPDFLLLVGFQDPLLQIIPE
jgi:hypothetical protein